MVQIEGFEDWADTWLTYGALSNSVAVAENEFLCATRSRTLLNTSFLFNFYLNVHHTFSMFEWTWWNY